MPGNHESQESWFLGKTKIYLDGHKHSLKCLYMFPGNQRDYLSHLIINCLNA